MVFAYLDMLEALGEIIGGKVMGKAKGQGRKPAPTALKVLKGNPGKRKINKDEPEPKARLPEPPDHLSDVAKEEWERTGGLLLEMGLMTELDVAALAGYCMAYSHWVIAEAALQEHGMLIKSPKGEPIRSPYWGVATKSMDQMRSFLTKFGMSPSSRSGVSAAEKAGSCHHVVASSSRKA